MTHLGAYGSIKLLSKKAEQLCRACFENVASPLLSSAIHLLVNANNQGGTVLQDAEKEAADFSVHHANNLPFMIRVFLVAYSSGFC